MLSVLLTGAHIDATVSTPVGLIGSTFAEGDDVSERIDPEQRHV